MLAQLPGQFGHLGVRVPNSPRALLSLPVHLPVIILPTGGKHNFCCLGKGESVCMGSTLRLLSLNQPSQSGLWATLLPAPIFSHLWTKSSLSTLPTFLGWHSLTPGVLSHLFCYHGLALLASWPALLLPLLRNLYWSIVALQCYISFYFTDKWISHRYTCILFFGFPSHFGWFDTFIKCHMIITTVLATTSILSHSYHVFLCWEHLRSTLLLRLIDEGKRQRENFSLGTFLGLLVFETWMY